MLTLEQVNAIMDIARPYCRDISSQNATLFDYAELLLQHGQLFVDKHQIKDIEGMQKITPTILECKQWLDKSIEIYQQWLRKEHDKMYVPDKGYLLDSFENYQCYQTDFDCHIVMYYSINNVKFDGASLNFSDGDSNSEDEELNIIDINDIKAQFSHLTLTFKDNAVYITDESDTKIKHLLELKKCLEEKGYHVEFDVFARVA